MRARACALAFVCLFADPAWATIVLPEFIRRSDVEACAGGPEWLELRRSESRAWRANAANALPAKPALRAKLVRASGRDPEATGSTAQVAAQAAAQAAADAAATAADAAGVGDPAAAERQAREFRASQMQHVKQLRRIVEEDGIPTVEDVGDLGMFAFVDLIESASLEPDLQLEVAGSALKASDPSTGRIHMRRLTELIDHILVDGHRPQRYGTVFDRDASGQIDLLQPIEERAGLAERRDAAGLVPLATEVCARRNRDSLDSWPLFL